MPVGYEVITHQTILPAQILAAQVQLKGAKIRIISVYLHPDNVQENLQILIKYLNTIDLRDWTILAGDFNRADEQCSKLWHQLTEEYGLTDSHPTLPTFRTAHGESCLDRILLPTAFLQNLHLRHSTCLSLHSHSSYLFVFGPTRAYTRNVSTPLYLSGWIKCASMSHACHMKLVQCRQELCGRCQITCACHAS